MDQVKSNGYRYDKLAAFNVININVHSLSPLLDFTQKRRYQKPSRENLMAPFPPWSDLPPELLSAITKFLEPNPLDILRFRAVCNSWLSTLSPPSNLLSPLLPLRLPPPPPPLRTRFFSSVDVYFLSATAVLALHHPDHGVQIEGCSSTPKTWIAFVEELNSGKVSIRQPFTKDGFVKRLDSPRKINLLDFDVGEIGRYYNLTAVCDRGGRLIRETMWRGEVRKVVLSLNGPAVLVLFEVGKLGLVSLGVEGQVLDTEWQIIHDGKGYRLDDIIDYKGMMLGIDRRGKVYEIGYCPSKMKVIVGSIVGGGGRRKRLIESSGILHLVVRCNDHGTTKETGKFKVYMLNEEIGKWVEVTSINDQIFFFGHDFSFSTSAKELEGSCGGNCIIYYCRSFEKYAGGYDESWLFDTSRSRSLEVGVYHLEDGARIHAIESYPGYCNMLGPHPTWLWRNKKLKLLGILEVAMDKLLSRISDEKLKAKFIGLSPLVGAIVSGDGISQQDTLAILQQADMLNYVLSEIVVEIEDESKRIRKSIAEDAQSRRPQSKSINLLNQEGTSSFTLGAENRNDCVDTVQNATQLHSNSEEEDWLSSEMMRRLGTHIELKVLLRSIICVIEENKEKSKDNVEFRKQAAFPEMRLLSGI